MHAIESIVFFACIAFLAFFMCTCIAYNSLVTKSVFCVLTAAALFQHLAYVNRR